MKILILTICILCSAALASAAESVRVLSFTASWCKPCQQMKASWANPIVQKRLTKFNFNGINTGLLPDYTNEWRAQSAPFGYLSPKNLEQFLNLPK